jgi:hypothetical protein
MPLMRPALAAEGGQGRGAIGARPRSSDSRLDLALRAGLDKIAGAMHRTIRIEDVIGSRRWRANAALRNRLWTARLGIKFAAHSLHPLASED